MSIERLKELTPGKRPLKPLLCLEVNPPRGTDLEAIFSRMDGKLEGVDFFNVTDSALARMRCAALPFASLLKQRFGIEPLVNFSCRDRNLIAIQGDLIAGWMTGVRAIVALTGDAVTIGDSPDRKGVFEVNSVGLLHAIERLNSGKDLAGNDLEGVPSYFPGVVVNPNAKNQAAELRRLEKKAAAGAKFALSQPVFDQKSSLEFFKSAQNTGVPILMGLLAFRHAQAAKNVAQYVPGIKLSENVIAKIESAGDEDLSSFFIEHCLNLAQANLEYLAGFHVVSGVTPKLGLKLAHRLSEFIKRLH